MSSPIGRYTILIGPRSCIIGNGAEGCRPGIKKAALVFSDIQPGDYYWHSLAETPDKTRITAVFHPGGIYEVPKKSVSPGGWAVNRSTQFRISRETVQVPVAPE